MKSENNKAVSLDCELEVLDQREKNVPVDSPCRTMVRIIMTDVGLRYSNQMKVDGGGRMLYHMVKVNVSSL
jgi:hypothetical protein